MSKIEEKIENLVEEPINKLGYKIYDVMYVKEGKDNYLKIFIDNNIGITLEDCEKVNNEITEILDTANYIKEQYFLEISSPGIERVIRKEKHLKENINQEVYIKTFLAIPENNEKEIIGVLKNFNEDYIEIQLDEKIIKIDKKNIALMKKNYNWE